jgi:hypothetical protein
MSKYGRLKRAVRYQTHTPRCATCKHYSQQNTRLQDTGRIRWVRICKLHEFTIQTHSCCDTWASKDGEVLE